LLLKAIQLLVDGGDVASCMSDCNSPVSLCVMSAALWGCRAGYSPAVKSARLGRAGRRNLLLSSWAAVHVSGSLLHGARVVGVFDGVVAIVVD